MNKEKTWSAQDWRMLEAKSPRIQDVQWQIEQKKEKLEIHKTVKYFEIKMEGKK